jgi:hypothetical protein
MNSPRLSTTQSLFSKGQTFKSQPFKTRERWLHPEEEKGNEVIDRGLGTTLMMVNDHPLTDQETYTWLNRIKYSPQTIAASSQRAVAGAEEDPAVEVVELVILKVPPATGIL